MELCRVASNSARKPQTSQNTPMANGQNNSNSRRSGAERSSTFQNDVDCVVTVTTPKSARLKRGCDLDRDIRQQSLWSSSRTLRPLLHHAVQQMSVRDRIFVVDKCRTAKRNRCRSPGA